MVRNELVGCALDVRDGGFAAWREWSGRDEVEGEVAKTGVGAGETGAAGGEGFFFGRFDDSEVKGGELAERANGPCECILNEPKEREEKRDTLEELSRVSGEWREKATDVHQCERRLARARQVQVL